MLYTNPTNRLKKAFCLLIVITAAAGTLWAQEGAHQEDNNTFLTNPSVAATDGKQVVTAPGSGNTEIPVATIFAWQITNALAQNPLSSELYNIHMQNTDIEQFKPGFPASYTGPYSLSPKPEQAETFSLDLYGGFHLWQGGELHVDGQMYQGYGLDNVHGVADFPNAEAIKVGTWIPKFVLPKLYYQQVFGFGGEKELIGDDQLHLASLEDVNRLTVKIGKFSTQDDFNLNDYATGARTSFMNWGLYQCAAWDAAGDAFDNDGGIYLEYNTKDWALRYGDYLVVDTFDSVAFDWHVLQAWQQNLEYERRFSINNHPGKVRLMGWLERTHAANLQDSVNSGTLANTTPGYNMMYGFTLSAQQEIAKDIGVFLRAGWNNGQTEIWGYTDCQWSVSPGLSIQGTSWGRPNDTFGTAFIISGLSSSQQNYFGAGGTGIVIGDGALSYGSEQVSETYYSFQVTKGIAVSADYQFINRPGYNCARGPVNVMAARLHFQF
jgi:high affinity Mn2+ porin